MPARKNPPAEEFDRAPHGAPPPPPPGAYGAPPPPPPPKPRRKKKQSPTTKLKRKIAKVTGIPTTESGRKKKLERTVAGYLYEQLDKLDHKK